MNADLQTRIDRAKELLRMVRHASMATVNADGSPHNTPYFFMYSPDLAHIFWGSHPESEHSKNIIRTGQLFVALYDGNERGGLYFRAKNGRIAEGGEFDIALAAHNAARERVGKSPLTPQNYQNSPQKMWMAEVENLWVNSSERGQDGLVTQDFRYEITAKDLLN